MLQELVTQGIVLESQQYDASVFGSFVVVLARGREKAKFIWDGKDSMLTVEYLKPANSEDPGSWKHDAYIQVPERRAVLAEIGSNAVAMLL